MRVDAGWLRSWGWVGEPGAPPASRPALYAARYHRHQGTEDDGPFEVGVLASR
jgi:hypothetical protein